MATNINEQQDKEKEVVTPTAPPAVDTTVATSESVTTKTKRTTVEYPTEPGPALDVMSAIESGIAEASTLSKEIITSKGAKSEMQVAAGKLASDVEKNKSVAEIHKLQSTLEAERDAKQVYEAMGGSAHLVRLGKQLKEAQEISFKQQRDVDKLVNEPGLLGAVRRFLFLGGEVQESNVAQATVNKYTSAISNISALATGADKAIDAVKSTISDATIAATSKQLAQQAALKAELWNIQAEESNAERATAALNFSNHATQLRIEKYRILKQIADDEETRKIRELQRKKLEKDARFEETLVESAYKGYKKIGVPVPDKTDTVAMQQFSDEVLTSYKVPGPSQAKVIRAYELGTNQIAPTAAETFRALQAAPSQLTDGKNRSYGFLNDIARDATIQLNTDYNEGKIKKVTPEMRDEAINVTATNAWKNAEKAILSGDYNNPNKAEPLSILVGASRDLKDMPLVVKVLKPMFDSGVKDLDPEKVLEVATAAVSDKTLTFNQAWEGIAAIYQRAIVYNNESQGRTIRGFPEQIDYNAKIRSLGPRLNSYFFGLAGEQLSVTSDIFDLSDEVQVKNLLLRFIGLHAQDSGIIKDSLNITEEE